MKARLKAWAVKHPTAIMRTVALSGAVLAWWRAFAQWGSPEGAVVLGCVGIILLVVASADVDDLA